MAGAPGPSWANLSKRQMAAALTTVTLYPRLFSTVSLPRMPGPALWPSALPIPATLCSAQSFSREWRRGERRGPLPRSSHQLPLAESAEAPQPCHQRPRLHFLLATPPPVRPLLCPIEPGVVLPQLLLVLVRRPAPRPRFCSQIVIL